MSCYALPVQKCSPVDALNFQRTPTNIFISCISSIVVVGSPLFDGLTILQIVALKELLGRFKTEI